MKQFFLSIVLGLLYVGGACAQVPCQWSYAFENGVAVARYCGIVASGGNFAEGEPPIISGTCGGINQTGGNTAGSFVNSLATCQGPITLTFSHSAPNGWTCYMMDLTNGYVGLVENGYTRNSASFNGYWTTQDTNVFFCQGF